MLLMGKPVMWCLGDGLRRDLTITDCDNQGGGASRHCGEILFYYYYFFKFVFKGRTTVGVVHQAFCWWDCLGSYDCFVFLGPSHLHLLTLNTTFKGTCPPVPMPVPTSGAHPHSLVYAKDSLNSVPCPLFHHVLLLIVLCIEGLLLHSLPIIEMVKGFCQRVRSVEQY